MRSPKYLFIPDYADGTSMFITDSEPGFGDYEVSADSDTTIDGNKKTRHALALTGL
jgi:hypothetical protein